MNEFTTVRVGFLSVSFHHMGKLNKAWRQEIHSWDRSIANSDLTLGGSAIDSLEASKVLEEGSVGSSHCEFELWQFWENTKVSLLIHDHSLGNNPSS